MQVTDRPSPDAPSLTQAIIVANGLFSQLHEMPADRFLLFTRIRRSTSQ